MSTIDFLSGRKVLDKATTRYNGEITVVRELAWGTYIKVGGLPQSGGLAKTIWQKSLRSVKGITSEIGTVLVLGYAGGGIAEVCTKYWPDCKIYGVDIDEVMVEFGRKHLGWDKTNSTVWIGDATEFVDSIIKSGKPSGKLAQGSKENTLPQTFDLVCVDMYVGSGIPEQFNTAEFAKKVKKLLAKDGIAVFNRLYGSHDTGIAMKFKEQLDKVYPNIKTVFPDANVMFICMSK